MFLDRKTPGWGGGISLKLEMKGNEEFSSNLFTTLIFVIVIYSILSCCNQFENPRSRGRLATKRRRKSAAAERRKSFTKLNKNKGWDRNFHTDVMESTSFRRHRSCKSIG